MSTASAELNVTSLDFASGHSAVMEVSQLLLEEVVHKGDHNPIEPGEIDDSIITDGIRLGHTLYAIFNPTGTVAAAAEVTHEDAGSTSVWRIAVAEAQRGKGLGTQLMKHVAAEGVEAGDQSVWAAPFERGFFEKLGFAKLGEESMSISAAELAEA